MSESPAHSFLKRVGAAFLYNQQCYLVDTEVKMNRLGLERWTDLDNHSVIDVLGVGLKYLPHGRKRAFGDLDGFSLKNPLDYEYGQNVTRGIEVKVSRPDFRNGFVCSGCNYHYLLAPMRLVSPREVPRWVGIIEYNRYKFSIEMNQDEYEVRTRPFLIGGLRVVRRPTYRGVPQFQIDGAVAMMVGRSTAVERGRVFEEIKGVVEEGELVYSIPGTP